MKSLIYLAALPVAALAMPGPKPFDTVPFAPATGQNGSSLCTTRQHHHTADNANPADMMDCLEIGTWASDHNGEWILKETTTTTTDDWHVLLTRGHCTFLVKNTQATSLGNRDVMDMVDAIHLSDGIRLGPIEEKGTFGGCQDDADVQFWLRDGVPGAE
ncbi:hypothetical protein F5Y17DRAFT_151109 [Xylariaceae sp. FL0594]|nr:hypothetical protein F5Y17DRAFT_151109 [Xylariaceae sp. FL0594]